MAGGEEERGSYLGEIIENNFLQKSNSTRRVYFLRKFEYRFFLVYSAIFLLMGMQKNRFMTFPRVLNRNEIQQSLSWNEFRLSISKYCCLFFRLQANLVSLSFTDCYVIPRVYIYYIYMHLLWITYFWSNQRYFHTHYIYQKVNQLER